MLETLFLYSAIGGGVVLLVQLAMMVSGMDDGFGDDASGVDGGDIDSDNATDGAGFWFLEMISLRTLAAAATFFGLIGGAADSMGNPPGVSIALACLAGYAAMYAVYWAFRQLFRLETSGNEDIYNAIGQRAEVYVPITASAAQAGKVLVTVQGRTVEYQALTDSDHNLPTGSKVLVMDVISSDTVIVAPLQPDHG